MTKIHKNKVFYLNCTAVAPHIGCMAVTDYHLNSLLGLGYHVSDIVYSTHPWGDLYKGKREESIEACLNSEFGKRIAVADIVVINGEGTLHHRPGMGILIAAATARKLEKPVYLVNTSIFAIDGFDDILSDLTEINVREQESSRFLQKREISHRLVLDSFLGADFFAKPNSDFAAKTVVMDWHPARDRDVGRAILGYFDSLPNACRHFLPLNHYSHVPTWRHTVANLTTSELIVTGRYHGVYLAGMAGCPFVALPSNTRKIQGLIESSGLPLPLCEDNRGIENAAKRARSNPALFLEFQAYLKQQLPLKTFEPLLAKITEPFTKPSDQQVAEARAILDSMIDQDRLIAQHRNLLAQNRQRVEFTPRKQFEGLCHMTLNKVRRKLGI